MVHIIDIQLFGLRLSRLYPIVPTFFASLWIDLWWYMIGSEHPRVGKRVILPQTYALKVGLVIEFFLEYHL